MTAYITSTIQVACYVLTAFRENITYRPIIEITRPITRSRNYYNKKVVKLIASWIRPCNIINDNNFNIFTGTMNEALTVISEFSRCQLYVLVNYNINWLEKYKGRTVLLEEMKSFRLCFLMETFSRITETTSTCIKNIFTNIDAN